MHDAKFTGHYDKNGKPVREGDIVRQTLRGIAVKGRVGYSEKGNCFKLFAYSKRLGAWTSGKFGGAWEVEVIGSARDTDLTDTTKQDKDKRR